MMLTVNRIFSIIVLVPIYFGISQCSVRTETEDYHTLFQATDSLEKRASYLMALHDSLRSNQNDLQQQTKNLPTPDTTWLEQLARQDVVLKNHDISFEKINKLLIAYNNYQNSRDHVSKEEFKAQVSEMEQGHTEIRNDLEEIENEQHTLLEEQERIFKELKDQNNQTIEDKR